MARAKITPRKPKAKQPRTAGRPTAIEASSSAIDPKAKALVQSEPPRDNDPKNLDPMFQQRLTAALDDLDARRTPFALVEGFRTVERQQWLYGSGRPNEQPYGREGAIVTYRDGVKALSNHQGTGQPGTGRGADCYPIRNTKVFILPSTHRLWDEYAAALERQGLTAGHRWTKLKDSPHAEMQVTTKERSIEFIRAIALPKKVSRAKKTDGASREKLGRWRSGSRCSDRSRGQNRASAGRRFQPGHCRRRHFCTNEGRPRQFEPVGTVRGLERCGPHRRSRMVFRVLQRAATPRLGDDLERLPPVQTNGHDARGSRGHHGGSRRGARTRRFCGGDREVRLRRLAKVAHNNGWLKLFDQQAAKEEVAHFQVATAQSKATGLVDLGVLAFSVEADQKITQVLFFKLKKSKAKLRYAGGTATIEEQVLGTVRDAMRKKLQSVAEQFIESIAIPPPG
jgi:hypothetical protein